MDVIILNKEQIFFIWMVANYFWFFYQVVNANTILGMSPLRMDLGNALIGIIHGKHGLFSERKLQRQQGHGRVLCPDKCFRFESYQSVNNAGINCNMCISSIHVYYWSSTSNGGSMVSFIRNGFYRECEMGFFFFIRLTTLGIQSTWFGMLL